MTTSRLKSGVLGILGGAALLVLSSGAAWATCIGTCGTDTANGDVTLPPGFSSYNYVTTTNGPTSGGNLPSVFGSPGVNSTNGSTFTSPTFTANAGDMVNFYFNYVTSDGSGFPDYAWAALLSTTGGPNYLIFSAQTQPTGNTVPGLTMPALAAGAALVPPTSPITTGSGTLGNGPGGPVWAELGPWSGWCYAAGCGLTGWIQSTFNGEAAGQYQLAFGVSNTNDTAYDSGLAYAGVTVGGHPVIPTPEPAGLGIFGLGLLAVLLGYYRVQRRRQEDLG